MKPSFKFLRWRYANDDKTKVEIQPLEQSGPLGASDLERALLELADVRNAVLPAVPDKLPPYEEWLIPQDAPKLDLGLDRTIGQPILNIRDGGRGWLHYRLSDEQLEYLAVAIAEHFQNRANSPPPTQGKH